MPPRRRYLITLLEFTDLSVVCASMVFAVALTAAHDTSDAWLAVLRIRLSLANLLFVVLYLFVWHLALRARGLYSSYRLSPATREFKDLTSVVAQRSFLWSRSPISSSRKPWRPRSRCSRSPCSARWPSSVASCEQRPGGCAAWGGTSGTSF